jgi:hypothetical protein
MASPWASLPNELVAKILEYTDYKTVTACRRVSRSVTQVLSFVDQIHMVLIGDDTSCAAASKT